MTIQELRMLTTKEYKNPRPTTQKVQILSKHISELHVNPGDLKGKIEVNLFLFMSGVD